MGTPIQEILDSPLKALGNPSAVDPGFNRWGHHPKKGLVKIYRKIQENMKMKKLDGQAHPKFYYVDPPLPTEMTIIIKRILI